MTDPLQILQAVNLYYETAFSHLLTITLAVLGFSSVILPAIFGLFQYRLFRTETTSLESQIAAQIGVVTNNLKTEMELKFALEKSELQKYFTAELESINSKLVEQVSVAKAGNFFLQGTHNVDIKKYPQATNDYALAADLFLLGNDDLNCQRSLKNLIEQSIPNLNSQSFETYADIDSHLDKLINSLDSKNEHGRFTDDINAITSGRSQAKKRNPVSAQPAKQASSK